MSYRSKNLIFEERSYQLKESTIFYDEFAKKILPTLPRTFKSLLDTPISTENDKPRELIQLLGKLLEITDYATNMASFWFLDTLALQMLRYKEDLDGYYMGVLISWLAGEIRLLRDRKQTREEFLRELKDIFIIAANKLSQQKRLPYWDEVVYEYHAEEEMEEKLSARNQSIESLQEFFSQEYMKLSSNTDPIYVLDIVIDATYDMYANELRYGLVYAVFVKPIEIQTYNLPFTLRTPRPVKLPESKIIPFDVLLQKSLRKTEAGEKSKKSNTKTNRKKIKTNLEVPPTPAPSFNDDKALMYKRLFILPLIEANEASEMFLARTHPAELNN